MFLQVKVWFQNRRMKWKRVKGTQLVKDKVSGQMKPISSLVPAKQESGVLEHMTIKTVDSDDCLEFRSDEI